MIRITNAAMCAIATLACLCAIHTTGYAKDTSVETILDDLNNPRGVAVRPGGTASEYEVYVADAGAGRVIRIRSEQAGEAADAITGFDVKAGPNVLLFVDRDHLVVGCEGTPAIRMYELVDQPTSQSADQPKQSVESAVGPEMEAAFAFARTRPNDKVPDMLIVAVKREGSAVTLGRVPIRAGTLDKLSTFVGNSQGRLPRGVAVGEQGYIAVSESDSSTDPSRNVLTFYDPASGATLVTIPILLRHFFDLAYHPTNGNLYALDSSGDGEQGGVYRLDDASEPGKPACKAVKIAAINKPTALAFAPNGTLYITTANDKQGKLLSISNDL
ncbi:MAG: hypothetical protein WD468_06780 [Pirellulales bacterium]